MPGRDLDRPEANPDSLYIAKLAGARAFRYRDARPASVSSAREPRDRITASAAHIRIALARFATRLLARRQSYRLSTKLRSFYSRPAFIERHRESVNARRPTPQPGTGWITFYTPAGRTQSVQPLAILFGVLGRTQAQLQRSGFDGLEDQRLDQSVRIRGDQALATWVAVLLEFGVACITRIRRGSGVSRGHRFAAPTTTH